MLAIAHSEVADSKRRRRTLSRPWWLVEMYAGLALPSSISFVLRKNGFDASIGRASMKTKELAPFIRGKLEERELPLTLFVGLPLTVPFQGVKYCIPHWLTIWGYGTNGEGKNGFYAYCSDTNVERREVPAGNTFMTESELVEKWTGLDYIKWWRRLYIDVSHVRENLAA